MHITKTIVKLQDAQALQLSINKLDQHIPKYKGAIEIIHETENGKSGYDYAIELHYHCENGCKGIILIHHHEGNTFLWHKATKEQDKLCPNCKTPMEKHIAKHKAAFMESGETYEYWKCKKCGYDSRDTKDQQN